MKRILSTLLLFACLFPLCGCNSPSIDPTLFYYCRTPETYQHFETDSIIVSEARDLTGHSHDLQYLVALYLAGPLNEELISPFPRKTRFLEENTDSTGVRIELSDLGSTMTDAEFSLAAVCLAKTCMGYTHANNVTIKSGARSITITADNIILSDTAIPENTDGE